MPPPWTAFSASLSLTANVMLSFLLLPLNSCLQNTTNYMKLKGGRKVVMDSTSSIVSVLPAICPSCTAQEELSTIPFQGYAWEWLATGRKESSCLQWLEWVHVSLGSYGSKGKPTCSVMLILPDNGFT